MMGEIKKKYLNILKEADAILLEEIKRRFDREGISIPYPQRDIHIHDTGSVQAGVER